MGRGCLDWHLLPRPRLKENSLEAASQTTHVRERDVVDAVFLVLGGATAFAAGQLGKNTVGTKQLKKNSVTAAKLKKNSVTGAKVKSQTLTGRNINLAKLGTVPSATLAATATNAISAESLSAIEATHLVGASGQPGFEGGSHNASGEGGLSFQPVGFYKDHEGIVHLDGIAQTGNTGFFGGGEIFTLPAGFRPASGKIQAFPGIDGGVEIVFGSNVSIEGHDLSGKVVGEAEELNSLSGITFKGES
jgi:hypothetical protein